MKKILLLIITLSLLSFPFITASAEVLEGDLDYLTSVQDTVFWISWDVSTPDIELIAPNGTIYDPTANYSNASTIINENSIYFILKNAPAGQWKVRYDKGDNTKLDISMHKYQSPIYIQSFTIDEVYNNVISVNFNVSGEQNIVYDYKITAVVDYSGDEIDLGAEGRSYVGASETRTVYLDNLPTYSDYKLKLQVWYSSDGADIIDFTYSPSFAYTNSFLESFKTDYELTVNPESGVLKVSIPNANWRISSFIVAVFENGESDPVMYNEYESENVYNIQLAFDPSATKVDIEVTAKVNGVPSSPVRKTFNPNDFRLSIPNGNSFNTLYLPMNYTNLNDQLITVAINEYQTEIKLNGDGDVNIELGDDWNSLSISYVDEENITWTIVRDVFIDRIAPILNLSQSYDSMVIDSDSISINGNVIDCNKVTINGETISIDKNGLFSWDFSLTTGANTIELVASDAVGNETRYTAVIYHNISAEEAATLSNGSDESEEENEAGWLYDVLSNNFWPMIIIAIPVIVGLVYAIIFWRKEKKI